MIPCSKCKVLHDSLFKTCTKCREYGRKSYNLRKEKGLCIYCSIPLTNGKKRCDACIIADSERIKDQRHAHKEMTFQHYGNKCACCGEDSIGFLTIDHINNDGAEHRKEISTESYYRWFVKNNYPSGYRILCINCNWGRSFNNGICPGNPFKHTLADNLIYQGCTV